MSPTTDNIKTNAQLEAAERVETSDFSEKLDPRLECAVLWRLDVLLVPVMCALYLLAFLDRSNIGNARVAGLQSDLGLTNTQYQTAITVTYVPYIVAELPSNLLMRKIGPKCLIPFLCLWWGVVASLQCKVNSYGALLACRFFLGLFEGGILPGIIFFLSTFYRPHELQLRIGLVFSATALSGAFSGLLAAAISPMEGLRGLHGWQWIFLLEGVFTVCFAIFAFTILPDTPAKVITLGPELADYCARRLKIDVKDEPEPITAKAILSAFKDVYQWPLYLCLFCNGVTLYGLAYFTPSIVQGMGYGSIQTQLMTVPPFAFAFVFTMLSAFLSDRYKQRGTSSFAMNLFGIIGFSMFLASKQVVIRYVGLCFAIAGVYAMAPSYCSWVPNNVEGKTKKVTAIAIAFICTNSGGIVSTWIYPQSDAPLYLFAAKFNLALSAIPAGLISLTVYLLMRQNKLKVEKGEELLRDVKGLSWKEQMNVLGNHHPDFKYTL